MSQTPPPSIDVQALLAEAQAKVAQDLMVPVFFDTLARYYGVRPQNDQEAADWLKTADVLLERSATESIKQAAAGARPIDLINQYLGNDAAAPDDLQHYSKAAADHAAQDPEFLAALAVLGLAEFEA